MTKVIGVRFRTSGRVYYFDPQDLQIAAGDGVIVETARGTEFGDVTQGVSEVPDEQVVQPLKPVVRVATNEDRAMRDANMAKEGDAFTACQKKIEQHKLDMKLVDVEYAFNGSKVVFYFTADERVDFRELVKDLASQFRTRIELRQIGVRDEAKMLGGLGSCGRPVCCKTFLDDFRPVSIKMAKEQSLSLSPTKISGLCGRLMCCLQYEQAAYEDMKRRMPRVNREVLTPDGPGVAIENNAITEKTRVRLTLQDGSIEVRSYHYEELAKPGDPLPQRRVVEGENPPAEQPVQAVAPMPRRQNTVQRPVMRKPETVKPAGGAQPEQADAADANGQTQGQGQNRRRHRSGRGHGGGKQQPGAQPEKQQPGAQPTKQQPQQRNAQQGGQPRPNDRQPQQRQNGDAQGQSGGAQDQARPNPNRRRRRRGGANRPKPETGGTQE